MWCLCVPASPISLGWGCSLGTVPPPSDCKLLEDRVFCFLGPLPQTSNPWEEGIWVVGGQVSRVPRSWLWGEQEMRGQKVGQVEALHLLGPV